MLMGNISILEGVWTTIALIGAACACALVLHVWTSYRAVVAWITKGRLVYWGPRHKFALGFLVGSALLLAVWFGFIALGGNAMFNPPPTDPLRAAASERAGWILITAEGALLILTGILMWAWLSVQEQALSPFTNRGSLTPLVLQAIDLGRSMGHAIANDAQLPVTVLDEIANDPTADEARRQEALDAIATLRHMLDRVTELHVTIKRLEDAL